MADDTGRYAEEMFPSDYASWRYCIEIKCDPALKPALLQASIAGLGDSRHVESRHFAHSYGKPQHEPLLARFFPAAIDR